MTVSTFEEITATAPEKRSDLPSQENSGRNNLGRITVRHQGGGSTRLYRIVDFRRDKDGVPGKIMTIEYDPNRTAQYLARAVCRRREALYALAGRTDRRQHGTCLGRG